MIHDTTLVTGTDAIRFEASLNTAILDYQQRGYGVQVQFRMFTAFAALMIATSE